MRGKKTHRLEQRCEHFRRAVNGERLVQAAYVARALLELSPNAARGIKRKQDLAAAIALLRPMARSSEHRQLAAESLSKHSWLRAEVMRVLEAKRAARRRSSVEEEVVLAATA